MNAIEIVLTRMSDFPYKSKYISIHLNHNKITLVSTVFSLSSRWDWCSRWNTTLMYLWKNIFGNWLYVLIRLIFLDNVLSVINECKIKRI